MDVENVMRADSECSRTGTSRNSGGILNRVDESEREYQQIKNELISGMGAQGNRIRVQNVYRKAYSTPQDHEKLKLFIIFKHGLEKERGGNVNESYAWYGGSREQIYDILSNGFFDPIVDSRGTYLSPRMFPMMSLQSAVPDADRTRYLLFCRVLLGKTEVVPPGSAQTCPSSVEFDSGVDSLTSPTKYIIWNSRVNFQILPEYLVSFRELPATERVQYPDSISALFSELMVMFPKAKTRIENYQKEIAEGMLTKEELLRRLRELVGDNTLLEAMQSCMNKQNIRVLPATEGVQNRTSLSARKSQRRQ